MQFKADSRSTFNFLTIRYVLDARRDFSVPIGVILCSPETGYWQHRLPGPDERVEHVVSAEARPHLLASLAQVEAWIRDGELPYSDCSLRPLTAEWWEHVRSLMTLRVQLGPPQPIDCVQPEDELDLLFDALVQPTVSTKRTNQRVDSAVTRALGDRLARQLPLRKAVAGFGGREVRVLRSATDARKVLVVDAVSLASKTATDDADAFASRLQRVQAATEDGTSSRAVQLVLGYLASPHGLNGEEVMKLWIEKALGVAMYDLIRQHAEFHEAAQTALADMTDYFEFEESTGSAARVTA